MQADKDGCTCYDETTRRCPVHRDGIKEEMPKDQVPGLNQAEYERLAILAEEMGEAIQVIGKILRHGYASWNPFDDDKTANRLLLEKEMGDVMLAMALLYECGDLNGTSIWKHSDEKRQKIQKYLHHQQKWVQAQVRGKNGIHGSDTREVTKAE